MTTPDGIKKLAVALAKLPSIGPRQAMRLAFYLAESNKELLHEISAAGTILNGTKICRECFFVHENRSEICSICDDSSRAQNIIAVVEKATDLISLERTKKFLGRYLVLGDLTKTGVLDPEQKLRLDTLKRFICDMLGGQSEEIILAISPTAYGDLNASMLMTELQQFTKKISRLGRGIPTGGEIEFADEETLKSALLGRN
ncbi:MAG: toprim domain-containing protein [bacterium]|nr:toprim domain-containing protein [bacterium]